MRPLLGCQYPHTGWPLDDCSWRSLQPSLVWPWEFQTSPFFQYHHWRMPVPLVAGIKQGPQIQAIAGTVKLLKQPSFHPLWVFCLFIFFKVGPYKSRIEGLRKYKNWSKWWGINAKEEVLGTDKNSARWWTVLEDSGQINHYWSG